MRNHSDLFRLEFRSVTTLQTAVEESENLRRVDTVKKSQGQRAHRTVHAESKIRVPEPNGSYSINPPLDWEGHCNRPRVSRVLHVEISHIAVPLPTL